MATYKISAELNLKKIIDESREVAQALNEFADNLERIEKKYAEPCEDCISRQAVLDKWENTTLRGRNEFDQVIMMLPSVTAQKSEEV